MYVALQSEDYVHDLVYREAQAAGRRLKLADQLTGRQKSRLLFLSGMRHAMGMFGNDGPASVLKALKQVKTKLVDEGALVPREEGDPEWDP